jgi:hypothetical protein
MSDIVEAGYLASQISPPALPHRGGCSASNVDGFPSDILDSVSASVGTVRSPSLNGKDARRSPCPSPPRVVDAFSLDPCG